MYKAVVAGLLFCCMNSDAQLRAADPPVSSTVRQLIPAPLHSDEIVKLLGHLHSQNLYVKHLENTRRAIEKELSIVRLMNECDRFGRVCTGTGIDEQPRTVQVVEPPPAAALSADAFAAPLISHTVPPILPVVAGIYHDTALLFDQGRVLEVRRGAEVGVFTVTKITLDGVELTGPDGVVSLSVHEFPPHSEPGTGEFLSE